MHSADEDLLAGRPMRRVMIIGGAGAGKSTLAIRLGEITGLPVVHIDPMYWKPGWVQRDTAETHSMIRAAVREPAWIFDGNSSATFGDRLARADTLIFLDFSTGRRLWRVLGRTLASYGKVRPDMQEDCPERFDFGFLRWVAGYSRDGRRKALALLRSVPPHMKVHHFRSPSDVRKYLETLRHQVRRRHVASAV